jgi:hypothetical protein
VNAERWLSGGTLVAMPAAASLAWALDGTMLSTGLLIAVMLALPLSASSLVPLAHPSLDARVAMTAGVYALAAIAFCGALALMCEAIYLFVPPSSAILAACLVALVVYAAGSAWAFRRSSRVLWGWPAAIGAGIATWIVVLMALLVG